MRLYPRKKVTTPITASQTEILLESLEAWKNAIKSQNQ